VSRPAARDMSSCARPGWIGDRGRAQATVASIILGPVRWDGWYAKWAAVRCVGAGQPWPAHLAVSVLMDRDDLTGWLGEIGCPALIVHGSEDAAIPPARAEQRRGGLAGPATFTLIGAPHASKRHLPRCGERRNRELPARAAPMTADGSRRAGRRPRPVALPPGAIRQLSAGSALPGIAPAARAGWLPEWPLVWPAGGSWRWQRPGDQVAVDVCGDAGALAQRDVPPTVEGEEPAAG